MELEDVLKMSWRCVEDIFARRLEGIFAKRLEDVLKTYSKRLEDVLKTSWGHTTKTNISALIKASWKRLLKMYDQAEYICLDQDIFWKQRG